MEAGLRGNRAPLLQQLISQGDHTLRPGFEYWITGAANLWIPATSPSDSKIVINNATTNALTITSNGGTPISGVARSSGAALPGSDQVRILPGQQASFVMGDRGWFAQGCEPPALVFAYNGTPLASNPSNPLGASDLFHWLGIQAGGGSWVSPAGTSWLASAASGMVGGTVANLTDRVGSGQNIYTTNAAGSWLGWQFPRLFRCLGFMFQTYGGASGFYPRSFSLRQNTGTTLVGANPETWAVAGSWTNQVQLNALNQYSGLFATTSPVTGNQLVLRLDGPDSSGSNYWTIQEAFLFGEYFV